METTASNNFSAGRITNSQRIAICNLSGHSFQMAKDYYVIGNLGDQYALGMSAINWVEDPTLPAILPLVEEPTEAEAGEVLAVTALVHAALQPVVIRPAALLPVPVAVVTDYTAWGTLHPQFASTSERVVFSPEEIAYLCEAAKRFTIEDQPVPRFTSLLLAYIHADPLAIDIFHSRHILKPDRLRQGLKVLGYVK